MTHLHLHLLALLTIRIPMINLYISNDNNTLLANTTSLHDNISPADICKVLSITNSNNPTSQKGKSASTNSATGTIDGTKYRQCNTHTTYEVSIHTHKTSSSLVDRGSNGGISGNGVCRTATCSDKNVNVISIDNHQLCAIPLVSAG